MSRPVRDPVGTFNELLKHFVGFLNALGLGLIGFAFIRPATESLSLVLPSNLAWSAVGVAAHAIGLYLLRHLKKEASDAD